MPYFDHFSADRSTALGNLLTKKTVREEYRFLCRRFPCDGATNILEIGPGHGELARLFLEAGFRNYDIVEPNAIMREELITAGVRQARDYLVPKLDEKDSSYDLIIVSNVFEHLSGSGEGQTFIGEAARVLRPGGGLFLLSPDYLEWREDFFNCDFSHSNPTTVRRVAQMFHNVGMETQAFSYRYSSLSGVPGWILSRTIKLLTAWTGGESGTSKAYKLRLTFLRRFMILGRKRGEQNAQSHL